MFFLIQSSHSTARCLRMTYILATRDEAFCWHLQIINALFSLCTRSHHQLSSWRELEVMPGAIKIGVCGRSLRAQ
jgi:hypothetical protein